MNTANIPNRFLLRKKLFDYLSAQLASIAVVDVEHPTTSADINKPKIVITPIRNAVAGRLLPTAAVNVEIQITYYARDELQLTKPTGIIPTCEQLMQQFLNSPIMPEYSNGVLIRTFDSDYVPKLQMYFAFSIYKFFLGSIRDA